MFLIVGACVERFRSVGWRWPGTAEFFRVSVGAAPPVSLGEDVPRHPLQKRLSEQQGSRVDSVVPPSEHGRLPSEGPLAGPDPHGAGRGAKAVPPAKLVQPLLVSKVNTVFQMALIGGCVSSSLLAWPPEGPLWVLGWLTAATTCASGAFYLRLYLNSSQA